MSAFVPFHHSSGFSPYVLFKNKRQFSSHKYLVELCIIQAFSSSDTLNHPLCYPYCRPAVFLLGGSISFLGPHHQGISFLSSGKSPPTDRGHLSPSCWRPDRHCPLVVWKFSCFPCVPPIGGYSFDAFHSSAKSCVHLLFGYIIFFHLERYSHQPLIDPIYIAGWLKSQLPRLTLASRIACFISIWLLTFDVGSHQASPPSFSVVELCADYPGA